MKIDFLNALYIRLVESRGYYPVRDQEGNVLQKEDFKVVQKRAMGADLVVDIINGDSVSADRIGEILHFRRETLETQPPSASISFFNIFVFESTPDPLKQEAIISKQYNKYPEKKYVACFTVNLSSKEVTKNFELPLANDGLAKTIEDVLNADVSGYGQLDVNTLMEQRAVEYTIELKAKMPFLTYAFIAMNVVVWAVLNYFVMVKGFNYNELLLICGAKDNAKILAGEYWRFISPIFLHGGLTHLALNCYSLYAVGVTVERIYGHTKFFFIYLLAGIIGNIASFMFSANMAVGASGAIFGMLGALLYFGLEKPAAFKRYFGKDIIIGIVINVAYGLSNTRIDNFAHMGGLVGGFLSAGIVKAQDIKVKYFNRVLASLVTIAVIVAGVYYGFNNIQNKSIVLKERAQKLLEEDKWAEAEAQGEQLLKGNYIGERTTLQLSEIVVKAEFFQKKYDEAIEHAKPIAEAEPGYGNYLLGLCYYNTKEFDAAYKSLQIAKEHKVALEQVNNLLSNIESMDKQ